MKDKREKSMGKYFIALILSVFFLEGCASKKEPIVVLNDKKYSLYNAESKENAENTYEQLSVLDSADEDNIKIGHPNLLNLHWIHNNYGKLFSIVIKDGKFGIIDGKNKYVVNPEYDSISNLYNGFFIIKKDDRYGYINDAFEIVQEPKFLDAKEFSENIAFVKFSNNKWGCISDKMKVLLEGKYDEIFPFVNSYSRVVIDDKYGFINQKCEVVVEPKYDFVNDFYSKYTKVLLNNKMGYINKKGEEIVNPTFDYGQNFNE